MYNELINTQEFSGRKNGFYKKISTLEFDFSQSPNSQNKKSFIEIKYNPSSMSSNSNDFFPNKLNEDTIEADSRTSPNIK